MFLGEYPGSLESPCQVEMINLLFFSNSSSSLLMLVFVRFLHLFYKTIFTKQKAVIFTTNYLSIIKDINYYDSKVSISQGSTMDNVPQLTSVLSFKQHWVWLKRPMQDQQSLSQYLHQCVSTA